MRHKTRSQPSSLTGGIAVFPIGHMHPPGVVGESPGTSPNKEHSLPAFSRHVLLQKRIALIEGHPLIAEMIFEQCMTVVDLVFAQAFSSERRRSAKRNAMLEGLDSAQWSDDHRFYVFNELASLSAVKKGQVSLFLPDDCTPTEQTSDDMQKGASAWT